MKKDELLLSLTTLPEKIRLQRAEQALSIIQNEELRLMLLDLQAADDCDYQIVLRTLTILGLLKQSWMSWHDVVGFDMMMGYLLNNLNNHHLRAILAQMYKKIVEEIAQIVQTFSHDGYETLRDILGKGCPLCGK